MTNPTYPEKAKERLKAALSIEDDLDREDALDKAFRLDFDTNSGRMANRRAAYLAADGTSREPRNKEWNDASLRDCKEIFQTYKELLSAEDVVGIAKRVHPREARYLGRAVQQLPDVAEWMIDCGVPVRPEDIISPILQGNTVLLRKILERTEIPDVPLSGQSKDQWLSYVEGYILTGKTCRDAYGEIIPVERFKETLEIFRQEPKAQPKPAKP